jgi:hypothetical protein
MGYERYPIDPDFQYFQRLIPDGERTCADDRDRRRVDTFLLGLRPRD